MAPYLFTLKIGSFAPDAFRVLEFDSDEAISECPSVAIRAAAAKGDYGYDDIIGRPAMLEVSGDDFSVRRFGVVTECRMHPDSGKEFGKESFLYALTVRPRLHLLSFASSNRVFLDKDVVQIVTEVLEGSGFAAQDFRFDTDGGFPKREFTVQYNESDFDFISRLLEDEGIFYFFDHSGNAEALRFSNKISAIQPVPETPQVPLLHVTGLATPKDYIRRLTLEHKLETGRVILSDYNHDTPEVKILGLGSGHGDLEAHAFAPHARNHDEAARMAGLRADMHESERVRGQGEGLCRAFRSGYRFRLDGNAPQGFQGDLTLVRVRQRGDQREGFEADVAHAAFSTSFTCMPATTPFRPPLRTAKPSFPGLLIAKADGVAGSYAYLDPEGRYRMRMPFDESGRKDGQASLPVRLCQPYAGPNYGAHFPLHIGNDLVLGFVAGDIDRPIALGALPNPSQGSPVTSRNKTESLIRTASGHQLRMDDREGKTAVDMLSSGGHVFSMNDDAQSRGISLATQGNHSVQLDDTGKLIRVRSKFGHEILMDDDGKTITIVDGSGKTKVTMESATGNIEMKASGDISLQAGGSFTLSAGKGISTSSGDETNMKVGKDFGLSVSQAAKVESGKAMRLAAGKDLSLRAADSFRVEAKKGSLEMSQELQCQAPKILASADDSFQSKAGKITLDSDGKLTLKGSQITQN